jgi:hypothetical protein
VKRRSLGLLGSKTEQRSHGRRDVAVRDAAMDGFSFCDSRADGQEPDVPSPVVAAAVVLESVHPHAVEITAVIGHDD